MVIFLIIEQIMINNANCFAHVQSIELLFALLYIYSTIYQAL